MARFAVLIPLVLLSGAAAESSTAAANPIRKVVTLLQNMQHKVTEEGKLEQDLLSVRPSVRLFVSICRFLC